MFKSVVVVGSNGGIGAALIKQLSSQMPDVIIHALARKPIITDLPNVIDYCVDFEQESAIEHVRDQITQHGLIDCMIIATGLLHNASVKPEKTLKQLSYQQLQMVFAANTFLPAILAKYFIPHLSNVDRSVFCILSARVGSISDNSLGGWYAYRASKAALNMLIKTASIETARTNKKAIIAGLHPGTVNTPLSQPFLGRIDNAKCFSPDRAAEQLLDVIHQLKSSDNGAVFDWKGQKIEP